LLTLSSVVLAILPLLIIGVAVADDARDVVKGINTSEVVDLSEVEQRIDSFTGTETELQAKLASAVTSFTSGALGGVSQALDVAANLLIGLSFMLFLTYYLVRDGGDLVMWLKDLSTLPEGIEDRLVDEMANTTSAVLKGHILVAVAQGVIAGLGLWIFGVPNALFWTFVMVILSIIPIVGSMVVWIPSAIYLGLSGEVTSAAGLAVYGLVVVGMTDNILRPLVVDESADLHPAAIIIGVLGGVSVFGAVGLFIGPIVLGAFKSVLKVFMNNYSDL
jgi:Predicted permease